MTTLLAIVRRTRRALRGGGRQRKRISVWVCQVGDSEMARTPSLDEGKRLLDRMWGGAITATVFHVKQPNILWRRERGAWRSEDRRSQPQPSKPAPTAAFDPDQGYPIRPGTAGEQ